MALPVILIDSTTGSDTAASGAGPTTALTGSSASTSSDGLTVTLDGSPDLSNVATDGSHVIYLADSTAGNRNFGKITAKDNGAKTVAVSNAFGTSLSGKSWAIGGKRASLLGTNSRKLLENNSSNGDALAGWTMQLASGHSETFTTTLTYRRSGDTTSGVITVCGTTGGTRPILNMTADNTNLFGVTGSFWRFKYLWLKNTASAKNTAAAAFSQVSGNNNEFDDILIGTSTADAPAWAFSILGARTLIQNCTIGYVGNGGGSSTWAIDAGGFPVTGHFKLLNCWIHHANTDAIKLNGQNVDCVIDSCLITNNGGIGLNISNTIGARSVRNCTFDSNGSDALKCSVTGADVMAMVIANNIFSNNSGYGLNFSNASHTATFVDAAQTKVLNNCFWNNTSGKYNPSGLVTLNDVLANPNYRNAAGNDYTPDVTMEGLGYPSVNIGTLSSTTSYADVGCAQRKQKRIIRGRLGDGT